MGTKTYDNANDLITFSRASGGTALRKISYGSELVTNGTFDTDTTGWTVTLGTGTITTSGGYGVVSRDAAASGYVSATYAFPTVVGKTYSASGALVATDGTLGVIGKSDSKSNINSNRVNIYGGQPGTTTLGAGQETFVATSTTTYIHLFLVNAAGPSFVTCSFDNISVKEVLFDQPDGTLTLFNHPNDIPRIEYDAAGAVKGLLIEEARTNLMTYSKIASGGVLESGWLTQGATASAPTSTAPDGSTGGVTVSITSNTGLNLNRQITGLTVGQTYTASMWLKGTAGEQVYFFAEDAAAAQELITFTGEWQRVSKTYTATAAAQYIGCELFNRSGGAHLTNVTFEAWGAQYELGSFPTSYIPTSGATATRAADIASIPTSAFGYNQKQGSIVVDVSTLSPTATSNPMAYQINDGTTSERLTVFGSSANWRFVATDGGVGQADILTGVFGDAKIASSFTANKFNHCVDGTLGTEDTSGTMPTVSELQICRQGAGNYLNGHIKSIAYYPRRLTNAQLQELTT